MHWLIAAPFLRSSSDGWLQSFVPNKAHTFEVIPARYLHDRSRARTGLGQWRDYFEHGGATWKAARQARAAAGVITSFPQLALTVGLRKRLALGGQRIPVVAHNFNLGGLYGGQKQRIARLALAPVDQFIVHSRREIDNYSQWLDLPKERFRFIPLQRAVRPVTHAEEREQPFVVAMGTANRDYRTFLAVMGELRYPTILVAGAHALDGLAIPDNVRVRSDVPVEECYELTQRAAVNVVPIDNATTASGQVTLLDAMGFGRATVATASIGTEDYAEDGKTALLVQPHDPAAMRTAIRTLWTDADLRSRLGTAAKVHAERHFSDEAAGRYLGETLDAFCAG